MIITNPTTATTTIIVIIIIIIIININIIHNLAEGKVVRSKPSVSFNAMPSTLSVPHTPTGKH